MNETFHISDTSLRSRRRGLTFAGLVVMVIVVWHTYDSSATSLAESAPIAAVVLGIFVLIAARQYKAFSLFARNHTLIMQDEVMLFRDGDTERRVPYNCIERLTFSGTLRRVTAVGMQCRGLPEEMLSEYEQFPRVVELLLQKTPQATLRARGLFTYNNAFKERRAKRARP